MSYVDITLFILGACGLIGAAPPLIDHVRRCIRLHSPIYHDDSKFLDEQIAREKAVYPLSKREAR